MYLQKLAIFYFFLCFFIQNVWGQTISVQNVSHTGIFYEACRGDQLKITLQNLSFSPTNIDFQQENGGLVAGALTLSNAASSCASIYCGDLDVIVPSAATTGYVKIYGASTAPTDTIEFMLLVVNPTVSLAALPASLCSTDSLLISGTPTGGTFWCSRNHSYLSSTTGASSIFKPTGFLNGVSSDTITIMYTYRPPFQTAPNQYCADKTDTTVLTIRNSDFKSIVFADVNVIDLNPVGQPAQPVALSSIISRTTPMLLAQGADIDTVFWGTGVRSGYGLAPDSFYVANSGSFPAVYTISAKIINGQCQSIATGRVKVIRDDLGRIYGLPNLQCVSDAPTIILRDTAIAHAEDTTVLTRNRGFIIYGYNRTMSVTSKRGGIRFVNGQYVFYPDSVLVPTGNPARYRDTITVSYFTYRDTYDSTQTLTASAVLSTTTRTAIVIVERKVTPTISTALRTAYCESAGTINLTATPTGGDYYLKHMSGIAAGQVDTLSTSAVVASNLHSNETTNTNYRIKYVLGSGDCRDSTEADFMIIEPLQPAFIGRHATSVPANTYCADESLDLLQATPAGGRFSGLGIYYDSVSRAYAFEPSAAASAGSTAVVYTYTDQYNCVSTVSNTLHVTPLPLISLQSNHSANNDIFCDNDRIVRLIGQPAGGVYATLGTANGVLQDSTYRINGHAGTVQFTYTATGGSGCQNKDTLTVYIRATSNLTIQPADTQFCRNALVQTFTISGNVPSAGIRSDTGYWESRGHGFLPNTGYYTPSNVDLGRVLDTIYYYHINVFGCKDTTMRILHIDTIPRPVIQLARDTYCINNAAVTLVATPQRAQGRAGVFAGAGVRQDTFDIGQAGLGRRILSYTFTNNKGCTGIGYDTVQIISLPTANFGALDSQFCQNDSFRVLQQTQLAWGRGVFSGNGVSHDTLFINRLTAGLKYITYTFTDTIGCSNSSTRYFRVNPLPDVRVVGLSQGYCANDAAITVTGVPANNSNSTRFAPVMGLATTSVAGVATFTPQQAASNTPITIHYTYQDTSTGCINSANMQTFVYPLPTIALNNLPATVCANNTPVVMHGTPAGGTFVGMGLAVVGVQHDSLIPSRAGAGIHYIRYIVQTTPATGLVCTNYDEDTILINPQPLPTITSPTRADYCTSDAMYLLTGGLATNNVTLDSMGRFMYFRGVGVRDSIVSVPRLTPWGYMLMLDTIYYFDPSHAPQGSHLITYEVQTTAGCIDSTHIVYDVYRTETPTLITAGRYCESDTLAVLVGIPAGGRFMRRAGGARDTISNGFYHPNPTYPTTLLTAAKRDTLIYEYTTGLRCVGRDTEIVVVNPIPQVDFMGVNQRGDTTARSCIGTDTIHLIPVPQRVGGIFSGGGVLYQTTQFLPNIAGAGRFPIRYEYTDTSTMCSNNAVHILEAYNIPTLNLTDVGGCGNAVVVLKTDSATGLSGIFAGTGTLYDSVTLVRWTLGDGTTRFDMPIRTATTHYIDTIQHLYNAAGIYTASLEVVNRGYCASIDSLRVVVSPAVVPTAAAPYDESFENSNGGWFDELEGAHQASNLWSWGIAQGRFINTTNNPHQKVWTTANTSAAPRSYGSESSWVYSPCFDLTQLTRPMISLDYFMNTDAGNDGVVIEYFDRQLNDWLPLGVVDRGINWYNEDVVAGRPGLQDLAPIGWSGEKTAWQNGRYKLDEFKHDHNWQFRIAFGAAGVQTRNLEGFAFDNVWIGNRTRNVLVEHFANVGEANMNNINRHVYDTCYHNDYVRDVVLIQPHFQNPSDDEFYNEASAANNVRLGLYGMDNPAYTVINGRGDVANRAQSILLDGEDFERDMLETPAFMIRIPTVQVMGNQLHVEAIIKANQDLTTSLPYFGYIAVTEDSLEYTSSPNTFVQSVLRELMPNNGAGQALPTTWAAGDSVTISGDWNFTWGEHNPDNFEIVVFVQTTTNGMPTTVYQVQTTRDISQYVGVVSPEVVAQAQEAEAAILYPNPAEERFNVSFEKPLSRDYNWKLVDMHGREIMGGIAQAGTQQLEVSDYDVASGMYFFVMYTNDFVTRRKVILSRP